MFNNNYWMIFKAVLPIAAIVSFANIPNCDFLNTCKLPVVLTVPFYTDGSEEPEACDIVLQPGDFYQAIEAGNGYVYEKYGLMPGIAQNAMETLSMKSPPLYSSPEKELNDYDKLQKDLASEKMPSWWVKNANRSYEMTLESYIAAVKNLESEKRRLEAMKPNIKDELARKDFYESYSNYICAAKSKVSSFSYVTNITQNKLEHLVNPDFDVDNDGLVNRDELRCRTNPIKPNCVAFYPQKIKITPNGNEIITNEFQILNLTQTNICCKLVPYSIIDKFAPKIEGVNIRTATNASMEMEFSLNAKSAARFLLLWRSEKIPYRLPPEYHIDLYTGETCQATLRPFTINSQAGSLEAPVIVAPNDGECLPNLKNIKFTFDSKDDGQLLGKDITTIANKRLKVEAFVYDISGNNMKRELPLSLPDSYLYSSPDGSMTSFDSEYFYVNDLLCDFVPSGNYIWRLVKQNVYSNVATSDWRWFCIGTKIGSESRIDANEYYSEESRNNSGKKPEAVSYYHVNMKNVTHKLIVNVPFEYYADEYYRNFEGKNGPKLDENVKTFFSLDLPEGLIGEKTSADFSVSGVPGKAGSYTNFFVVSDDRDTVKQMHVFQIIDTGQPAPPKKGDNKHQISFAAVHSPNLVVHRMKVGRKDKYPMGLDWMCVDFEKRKNIKMEKQLEVSFLEPLPAGFDLTVETDEINGKTFVYHMLCDIPEKDGVYTNYARIVNTEFVYTNMHIFNIEKP